MKTKFQKTFTSLLLIAALAVSGISYQGKQAKAADAASNEPQILFDASDFNNLTEEAPLEAGTPATYDFTIPDGISSNTYLGILFYLYPAAAIETSMDITDSSGKSVFSDTIPVDDDFWDVSMDGAATLSWNLSAWESPVPGTYTLSLTFAEDTFFLAQGFLSEITQNPTQPTQTPQPTKAPSTIATSAPLPTYSPILSTQKIEITAGFSETIAVRYASDAITWSSGNNSIATVKGGKITAKKAGTTTVTARTAGGYTMYCTVKVVKNAYKTKKAKVSEATSGECVLQIYNISYDKKGNIIMKTRILNNTNRRIKELHKVKITLRDKNGKNIGTYSAKKIKKVNLKAKKAKSYTFKIKKSKLKSKSKADLPLMTRPDISGDYIYYK